MNTVVVDPISLLQVRPPAHTYAAREHDGRDDDETCSGGHGCGMEYGHGSGGEHRPAGRGSPAVALRAFRVLACW